jgi:hypothetical protein
MAGRGAEVIHGRPSSWPLVHRSQTVAVAGNRLAEPAVALDPGVSAGDHQAEAGPSRLSWAGRRDAICQTGMRSSYL